MSAPNGTDIPPDAGGDNSTVLDEGDPNNQYGFIPDLGGAIFFTTLFALLGLFHLGLTFKSRRWWLIASAIGALCEVVGWAAKIWGHYDPDSETNFLLQQVLLVIGPVFFSASCYVLFAILVPTVSTAELPMKPKAYMIIFIVSDVITLIIQAVGGGIAGTGVTEKNQDDVNEGTHIYLAGIVVQLFSSLVFTAIVAIYVIRTRHLHALWAPSDPRARSRRMILYGTLFAMLMIEVRGIYRTIELAQGWNGFLVLHEAYFFALDASLMSICLMALAYGHPAFWHRGLAPNDGSDAETLSSEGVGMKPLKRAQSGSPASGGETPGRASLAEHHGVAS